ncbi:tetratricopeptide repeat protein [Ferruginibacter sp. SUN106]|uniref:ATP-binding protein n=1 Tax=Ferruginibacter sp. SUN106 TaxID=2978348 RepID=UPI003D36A4B5
MRKFLLIIIFFSTPVVFFGQHNSGKDSLLHLLAIAKTDTTKANLYFAVSELYENSAPDSARYYIAKGGDLSKQLNYKKGILKSYRMFAYVLSFQSKFDSVLYYNKLVLDIARKDKDSFNIGVSLFNIGTAYRFMSELDSAVQYTLEGSRILDGKGYYNIESTVNDGLQSLYMTLGQYDKAIEYGNKAVSLARKINDKGQLANALSNLGLSYAGLDKLADAKKLFNEAIAIAKTDENKSLEAVGLNNLSDIAIKEGNFEILQTYGERSVQLAGEMGDDGTMVGAKLVLAVYHLSKRNYVQAQSLANEALQLAQKQNLLEGRSTSLGMLSNIAFAMQDYKKGFQYFYERDDAQAKAFNESMQQKEVATRIKYETEKKDNQILLQQVQIQKKNTLNYLLMGGAVALVIISLLAYRTLKQKQKLQQQRINELETERQLTATEAVLKGEEQERTRLAKDLHDGLGGMLSGIKYSFNTMRGNLVMTPDNAQAFERSMDMLDSSIKEMRRVAHNMMPEALVKFGLDTALKDFCADINNSGALQVSYQSIGLENVMIDQTVAITIYRIVQELINNTMKHAAAKTAVVQVSKTNNQLTVTVEDDGKGFDTAILNRSGGIGWSNIQNRVEFLKGNLDVQSGKEKGTSVHIEINNL